MLVKIQRSLKKSSNQVAPRTLETSVHVLSTAVNVKVINDGGATEHLVGMGALQDISCTPQDLLAEERETLSLCKDVKHHLKETSLNTKSVQLKVLRSDFLNCLTGHFSTRLVFLFGREGIVESGEVP